MSHMTIIFPHPVQPVIMELELTNWNPGWPLAERMQANGKTRRNSLWPGNYDQWCTVRCMFHFLFSSSPRHAMLLDKTRSFRFWPPPPHFPYGWRSPNPLPAEKGGNECDANSKGLPNWATNNTYFHRTLQKPIQGDEVQGFGLATGMPDLVDHRIIASRIVLKEEKRPVPLAPAGRTI
ncbi:hypothetical protein SODALDRAFT_376193 [Sodiomyces alkalinus F11]|uniref:Uncharacterized protein n=1 Tax=Sodiomyces alkalinus (strain CBS 110278 / VKM F-3762 / F11) TaxID=1314773 RepID=A0A3N2Q0V9_SODAK|nr:hypothetical protein SODALDRAFT_376193 [Sodiomyces alkalinus F11]ROT40403.1 hypothetical protein SODALDRAFT_376193 [Sodiomyces alkalinus F11]